MAQNIQMIRDQILDAMLPAVAIRGWTWDAAIAAANQARYQDTMPEAVFPGGMNEVVAHFSDRTDRLMLEKLKDIHPESLRVRERIRAAIMARYETLEDDRPAMRATPWVLGRPDPGFAGPDGYYGELLTVSGTGLAIRPLITTVRPNERCCARFCSAVPWSGSRIQAKIVPSLHNLLIAGSKMSWKLAGP